MSWLTCGRTTASALDRPSRPNEGSVGDDRETLDASNGIGHRPLQNVEARTLASPVRSRVMTDELSTPPTIRYIGLCDCTTAGGCVSALAALRLLPSTLLRQGPKNEAVRTRGAHPCELQAVRSESAPVIRPCRSSFGMWWLKGLTASGMVESSGIAASKVGASSRIDRRNPPT